MRFFITLLIAIAGSVSDPIPRAIEYYEKISSYQVTLITESGASRQSIRYFYKKQGYVKMEFIMPYKGMVLVFSPYTKKVKVTPFESIKFLHFSLDPDNKLIKSPTGHRIDKSDLGELLKSVRALQRNGRTEISEEKMVQGKEAIRLNVTGENNYTADGIHSYELWLERSTLLPLKVSSFDIEGKIIENVIMDDLEVDKAFPDNFFDQ